MRIPMSLKNKNNNNVNIDNNEKKDKNQVYNETDNDTEECDKLLEQLDKMEENDNSMSISSKARNLIKKDKEAIREMNEKLNNTDNDELDYLDDEKEESIEGKMVSDDNQDNNYETDMEEANLDFLANLNKEDDKIKPASDKQNKRGIIRKQQPKRLHNDNTNSMGWVEKIKKFSQDNAKNFYIGTAIAFLFLALLIALIADSGNKSDRQNICLT